jgi:hypothetical protein
MHCSIYLKLKEGSEGLTRSGQEISWIASVVPAMLEQQC